MRQRRNLIWNRKGWLAPRRGGYSARPGRKAEPPPGAGAASIARPDPQAVASGRGGKVPVSSNTGPVRPPAGGSTPAR